MATALLTTKLRVPPPAHYLLERVALTDALERDLPGSKLVLVSAPAGYGKTTFVAEWARARRGTVAWLSAGEEDNETERFFHCLLAAWESVEPRVRESRLGLLSEARLEDIDLMISAFIDVGASVSSDTALVIDDAHVITDEAIHRALVRLIDHLPPMLHLVMVGRREPPLPLARYRARGELIEYRAEDLRFNVDESAAFLNDRMDLRLGDAEVHDLHARLEGWAAGLQLASLALRRSPKSEHPRIVSGRHRFISDYLRDDVLVWLPEEVRRFLLQTSILDRLTGSLCDAVTGRDDSQEMLKRLERENLFVVPLDDVREWYRYHRLFSDVLRQELGHRLPQDLQGLHQRAARWYLDRGLPDAAFQHAVEADDDETGFAVVDRYMNELLTTRQFRTIQRWLDMLPARWLDKYPVLGVADAGLLLMTGSLEAAINRLDEVDRRLSSLGRDDAASQRARVFAVRCFMACFQNDLDHAEIYADKALKDLPRDDVAFRADIFGALGDTYRRRGQWDEARAAYLGVLRLFEGRPTPLHTVHVHGALADLDLMRGRLRSAFDHWSAAIAALGDPESWGHLELPAIGWVRLRLGELLYEWNDLVAARGYLERGVASAGLGDDVCARIAGATLMARLHLSEGAIDDAEATLEDIRAMVEQSAFLHWNARFLRCQVELWIAQGRVRDAIDRVEDALVESAEGARLDPDLTRLTAARVLLLQGDAKSLTLAFDHVESVRHTASEQGRTAIEIEAMALRAILQWRHGDSVGAMTSVERALTMAEPEGYVRLFVDLGNPMARLLQEARSRHVLPDYVDSLLSAFGVTPAQSGRGEMLPEPLSPRELDVLHLIAAGLTNSEIAERLFISPETVKKHTGSIYGKLGVGNRTEAAARARSLGLLDPR